MVVGFIILIGLVVYLIISLVVVFLGVRYARKKGIPGWKGGALAAVVMYLLMFWDFIPFHVAHKYYCATEGGFTLNKTLEEWKAENPGVAETLVPNESVKSTKLEDRRRYVLNQRFAWDIVTTKHFLGIRKRDERIVDMKNSEILAQYVDFDSDQKSLEPEEFRDFKFWLDTRTCEETNLLPQNVKFNDYFAATKKLGKSNHGNK
ncbi:MAG: hypothetical protein K1563_18570 [Candidatus Thiodiazotropha sp. (ex. Lucinisca nassula)]|nr:hypothetical protein [Candidatus Thiodiazotropha sp. (ex. Lucinisca nassula)]MBW9275686.1 hypothetical protein [Candidatus Thiodiazotropha sp. (ex. Lucinisca nassula)]